MYLTGSCQRVDAIRHNRILVDCVSQTLELYGSDPSQTVRQYEERAEAGQRHVSMRANNV